MQDAIRKPPEPMGADLVKRYLLRFLPGGKALDRFGMGIRLQKFAEFNIDNLRDLAFGKLPASGTWMRARYGNTR